MSENKNENLDLTELKKDSLEIDELFNKFPAPTPSPALVDDIKRRINSRSQRISIPKVIFKTAVVAAVVVLTWSFMFDGFNRKNSVENIGESSGSVFSQADESLSEFEKEIDLLRSEFFSVCLNEENTNGLLTDTVTTVESQIIETDSSFWKG